MTKLSDKGVEVDNTVKIAMTCGRLPIRSAGHRWINQHEREKVPGVVLHMKNVEYGGDGYAELDLTDPQDAETYKVFKEWYEAGKDPRIKTHGVKVIAADSVPMPFPWWDNTSVKELVEQVRKGIAAMSDVGQREDFVKRCVKYEQQRENPRKSLISLLYDVELEGASSKDPMAVDA